mmetsp:Transcript_116736/g.238818  ORF Transcript_116736/g.238818 Transcript_116736/m.238818 type:complete len:93 (-) Transcript_116736:35-313(-)
MVRLFGKAFALASMPFGFVGQGQSNRITVAEAMKPTTNKKSTPGVAVPMTNQYVEMPMNDDLPLPIAGVLKGKYAASSQIHNSVANLFGWEK